MPLWVGNDRPLCIIEGDGTENAVAVDATNSKATGRSSNPAAARPEGFCRPLPITDADDPSGLKRDIMMENLQFVL